jgi:DNA-binding CsgD family transcriptional regulator
MASVSSSGADRVVGRENELSRLDAFIDDVADGPAVLLLEGESGIGKTTLWKRGAAVAAERGWRVLSTRPAESEAKLSYAGLADLLEGLADLFQALPDPQRSALEVALLKTEAKNGPSDIRAISAAVLTTLREAGAAGPVLIALDDVQWLDPSTASALGFAVRRLENEPIGLLLAQRETGAALPFGMARAFPEERIDQIRLEPLSVDDLGALLHARLGASLPRPTLKRLHEISGGNPFFAIEIARAELRGERRPTGAALPVPRTLRDDLLRDRLRALPSANRELFLYASASSLPTIGLLEAVVSSTNVAGHLTKAVDAGIVEIDGDEVRFTHPLYSSAIYADASRDHRHRVHRRLAQVVEDPEERARHLGLASDGPDDAVAAVLEDAARAAVGRGSPIAAFELCEMAERLTPSGWGADARRRRMASAHYRLLAGDNEQVAGLLHSVVSTAPSGPERAAALSGLGRALFLLDKPREAAEVLARALHEEGIPPASVSSIHMWRSWAVGWMGDLTDAERHAEEARRFAEESDSSNALADALTTLVATREMLGKDIPSDLMNRALELEEYIEPYFVYGRPSIVLAGRWTDAGELDKARDLYVSLLDEATDRGDEDAAMAIHRMLGRVELRAGNWEVSRVHYERGMTFAPKPGNWLGAKSLLEVCVGDVGSARADAEEALNAARGGDSLRGELLALSALGFLELSLGEATAASRYLARAWELHQASGIGEPAMFTFVADYAEALIELGRHVEAREVLDWLQERGQTLDRPWALAVAARYRGLLAAADGDFHSAFASIDRALKEHERLPMPFELGRTMLVLGTIRRRAKQKRPAREALEEALGNFERLGAPLWADKARAELARIGGRRSVAGQLTEAEARVAKLAAAGRTNREIADALFMSVRTVEGHLSRAYAKLGVRSRTELALYIDAIEQSPHS